MSDAASPTEVTFYYWMFNNSTLLSQLHIPTSHPLVSGLATEEGESLIVAISRIYSEESSTANSTSEYLRESLVQHIRNWLAQDNLLFQVQGDQRPFTAVFLETIRQDPAYKDLVPNSRANQGVWTLSENPKREIDMYLNNKLEPPDVELIPLDAMMLAIASGMHCLVYEQATIDDVLQTNLKYSHFDKSEEYAHHLWIFLYDKDNGKFLIRNNTVTEATAIIENADI
jgi:hypothetical protein